MFKYSPKNCKTWIFGKHQLIERFFVVAILKFSLFSACKSVHRAELFKQIMWFDLLRIMFFY